MSDAITVNGIEDVPKTNCVCGNVKIAVLQRGWIVVGVLDSESKENEMVMHKASVIRRWGTTAGLGQLSNDGPTSETILDPTHGALRFHPLTVVLMIDCEEAKWAKHLK